jgi:CO dehydrogenase maturation factor
MARTIAASGRGGTAKSTFCALLIEGLLMTGEMPLLPVDADPNSFLGLILGLSPQRTIGDIREDMAGGRRHLSPGVPKHLVTEQEIHESVVKSDGFDLVTMGRPLLRGE